MRTEHLQIGSLEVEVIFKPIKNLHLSVHPPDGRVTVSSPEFFDLHKIKVYLTTKLGWIKREQKKMAGQEREAERLFITRESHYFLGKRYLLKVIPAARAKIICRHNTLELYALPEATDLQKQKTLYNFYRRELQKVLAKFIHQYAAVMNVNVPDFSIRKMKTKWGSCTAQHQKLWFNIELAKKPLECIEYIVVHEMVHLMERNHNKRFVLLMNQYYPNWQVQKKVLNELPLA